MERTIAFQSIEQADLGRKRRSRRKSMRSVLDKRLWWKKEAPMERDSATRQHCKARMDICKSSAERDEGGGRRDCALTGKPGTGETL